MPGSKKQQACVESTKKCLKAHRKKPSSVPTPTSLSFFKIMIGDYQESMFIPPTFAQTFREVVNKDTYLEDSNGHCWRVRVSVVNGSLAFRKGWRDFVLDHNIELGELVIFKYISRSHLSTQIFGMSACERLHFPEKSNSNKCKRKRSKTKISLDILRLEKKNKTSEASKGKCFAVDEDPAKEDRAIEPVPCDLSNNKMTARNCVTKGVVEDIASPRKSPHCDSSGRLLTASKRNYYEAPSDTKNEDAMRVEEAGKIPFIDLCSDEDMDIEDVTKDYSFPSLDYSGGLQTTCQVEHATDRNGNLIAGSAFEQEAIMILPINSVVPETTEAQCYSQDADKSVVDEEILSCRHDSLIKYPLKSSAFEQEMMIIPPVDSGVPENIDNLCCSKDVGRLVVDEEKFSRLHNNLRISETAPTVELTETETKNQIEARWPIISCPLFEKGPATIDCSQVQKFSDKDWLRTQEAHSVHTSDMSDPEIIDSQPDAELSDAIVSSPRHGNEKCTEDEVGSMIPSNGVGHELLIPEDWISYNVDTDLIHIHEPCRDEHVGLCHTERGGGVHPTNNLAMTRKNSSPRENSLEELSSVPILNCTEDVKGNLISSCEPMSKDTRSEEQLAPGYRVDDASCIETVGSDPLSMTGISEFNKGPVVMDGDSHQTDLQEAEDKKVISCFKEVVKTESKDSISLPSPNYANFSFFATVNALHWLKLPESLPTLMGKKKFGRRVVTLRDPNMRSWPVLYHESFRFVGFIGGWEGFSTANNLLIGDRCEFELANEREPTLQVRRSKALHPVQSD